MESCERSLVALLVSAWIEIMHWADHSASVIGRTPRECVDWNCVRLVDYLQKLMSHSSWVRGLKYFSLIHIIIAIKVALLVSAWIEIFCLHWWFYMLYCRTPRECVDWNTFLRWYSVVSESRTPRECVDWNISKTDCNIVQRVALLVSAWIEIKNKSLELDGNKSRTPRECVDWNILLISLNLDYHSCRTPRECVDWNFSGTGWVFPPLVALLVSAWIEISQQISNAVFPRVALLVSAWIEILHKLFLRLYQARSHSSWVRGLKFCCLVDELWLVWVALLVSAWIEIPFYPFKQLALSCRTPRECVDWNK